MGGREDVKGKTRELRVTNYEWRVGGLKLAKFCDFTGNAHGRFMQVRPLCSVRNSELVIRNSSYAFQPYSFAFCIANAGTSWAINSLCNICTPST